VVNGLITAGTTWQSSNVAVQLNLNCS